MQIKTRYTLAKSILSIGIVILLSTLPIMSFNIAAAFWVAIIGILCVPVAIWVNPEHFDI